MYGFPLAVKLSPFFSAPANMAKQLDGAGANALVLFNRFYQPDLDLEQLEVVPSLTLSRPQELLLRLHWVAIIFGNVERRPRDHRRRAQRARCVESDDGGRARHDDDLGAAAQRHRASRRRPARSASWMEEHEYESIRQMCGSMSQRNVPNPAAFQRANYVRVLSSYSLPKNL